MCLFENLKFSSHGFHRLASSSSHERSFSLQTPCGVVGENAVVAEAAALKLREATATASASEVWGLSVRVSGKLARKLPHKGAARVTPSLQGV